MKVVYKNNDVRLELSRLAKQGDPKMKVGRITANLATTNGTHANLTTANLNLLT